MFDDSTKVSRKSNYESARPTPTERPTTAPATAPPPASTSRRSEVDFAANMRRFDIGNFFKPADENVVRVQQTQVQALTDDGLPQTAPTGEEAAARLKNEEIYYGPEAQSNRGRDFLETVNAHKDDPEFLRKMYESLGAEETARLLEDTSHAVANDNHNDFPDEAGVRQNYEAIARSLTTMPESFQYEVGAQAVKQGNYEVGVILSQSGGGVAAKRGFLDAIKPTATGDDYSNNFAARMAGEVLASDPNLVKEYLAGSRDATGRKIAPKWSAEETTKLLENGLATPLNTRFHDDWALMRGEGLERLVGMTADLKGADYADFRTRVFRDAATVLKDTDTGSPLYQPLVDNLQKLFLSDSRGIVEKLFNNRDLNSPHDTTGQALSLFLREAIFANPNPDGEMVNAVSKLMGDLRADMLNADNLDKNPDNDYYAKVLGDVLGSVAVGYKRAVEDNGEDQKAREALVGTLVDLASKPIDVGSGGVANLAKDEAKKLVTSLLSDFLNGDLKADRKAMDALFTKLLDTAFAGVRDFDSAHHTDLEANAKVNTIWVNYLQELFG